jgi:hypothetical protein
MNWQDSQVAVWVGKQTCYPNTKRKLVRGSSDFMELFERAKQLGYNVDVCKNTFDYKWVMSSSRSSIKQCQKCFHIMNLFIVHNEDSDYVCEYCQQSCSYKYICTRCKSRSSVDFE